MSFGVPVKPSVNHVSAVVQDSQTLTFDGTSIWTQVKNHTASALPLYLGSLTTAYSLPASATQTFESMQLGSITFGELPDEPYNHPTDGSGEGAALGGKAVVGPNTTVSVTVLAAVVAD